LRRIQCLRKKALFKKTLFKKKEAVGHLPPHALDARLRMFSFSSDMSAVELGFLLLAARLRGAAAAACCA
jgi:hypothetical protein